MNRVGLFFGSFDPPHIGHANVVMGVVNSKLVDKVLVIPAYQNVWKSNSSEFSYRLAMCRMTFSPLAPEDSIIEESIGDEIVFTLENEFSREVTFYERN